MMRNAMVAVASLFLAGPALAGDPLQVKPWVYDPDKTGTVSSAWVTKIGLPDAGKSNHALLLTKNTATATFAASGATVTFSGTLTELGFDVRNDSHCGAGAPRFNVYTADEDGNFGVYYFYGCRYGTHTPVPGNPGWTRVRFEAGDGYPSDGVSSITSWEGVEVIGIDIVFDEGTDVGVGYAVLDNIDVNGVLIGKPGAAK